LPSATPEESQLIVNGGVRETPTEVESTNASTDVGLWPLLVENED
jgi:hypothetical protein